MLSLFLWYLTVSLLGLITFPLTFRLLPALADRGYALSRALGLLLWGFIFWMLASLGILRNDAGSILLALAVVAGLSAWALFSGVERYPLNVKRITDWAKANWGVIFTSELVFLLAFAFMAFIRSANPDATGTEKPMELAFINAILGSPTFPPHDPWLSGYAISYYYFGYVIAAMLAKVTATAGTVAFNLMLALLFGLNAIGAFGIGYDLLSAYFDRKKNVEGSTLNVQRSSIPGALLSPLFLLLYSNLEGFLEVLHRMGIFWPTEVARSPFWTGLDIKDLTEVPRLPHGLVPDRFWWWWRSSRIIRDYMLGGQDMGDVISEMPAFSYVLGDLHPHVLAMPFVLLVVGLALNFFLGGWDGETNLFGLLRPRIKPLGFAAAALALGGLGFLNTWDFPMYLALFGGVYVLMLARESGWNWSRVFDFFEFIVPLAVASVLLYLPFYLSFSSQAGGFLPNLVWPVRGAHLWVMFGPFLVFIFTYLFHLWLSEKHPADWLTGWGVAIGFVLLLFVFSWLLGLLMARNFPDLMASFLEANASPDIPTLFVKALAKRFEYFRGLLTELLIFAAVIAFLARVRETGPASESEESVSGIASGKPNIAPFVLALILLGLLLILGPDFVYLRDKFSYRINTIFKFYYQAWLVWSLASAFGVAVLFSNLRGVRWILVPAGFVLVSLMALTFAPFAFSEKTNYFNPPNGFTLDAGKWMEAYQPDDALAIKWLSSAEPGVVAEAVQQGAYNEYARIATYSGLPTVLGWPGHEDQWRGGSAEMGSRLPDIQTLYESRDWNEAKAILEQYDIKYIYIGNLERGKYKLLNEEKFQQHLPVVYQQGSVTIYIVP